MWDSGTHLQEQTTFLLQKTFSIIYSMYNFFPRTHVRPTYPYSALLHTQDEALDILLPFLLPPRTPYSSAKYVQVQNSISDLLSLSLRNSSHRSRVAAWKPSANRTPPGSARPQRKLSTRRWERPGDLGIGIGLVAEESGWVAKRLVRIMKRANVAVSQLD